MKTKDIDNQPTSTPRRALIAEGHDHPAGHLIDWHSHRRNQLLYAIEGAMTVHSDAGIWVVPPHRAVWVPGGMRHQVRAGDAPLSMRTVKIEPHAVPGLPDQCCVVAVSPLLRELILAAVAFADAYDDRGADGRLARVLLDQIRDLPAAPLHLPLLHDRRLKRVARALQSNPAEALSANDWAARAGVSPRTFSRLFQRDTGMTFRQWRQQLRLLAALRRLAAGQRVNQVALDLGYESPSAFVAMFRRALGTTPGRYFSA
jgi:AraC-like DNA-binding protein